MKEYETELLRAKDRFIYCRDVLDFAVSMYNEQIEELKLARLIYFCHTGHYPDE